MKPFAMLLFSLLLVASCQNAEQVGEDGAANTAAPAAGNDGSFAAPISPGDSPTTDLITKDYWVIEFYVPFDNDYEKKMANKGRWYKFEKDGTFTCGQWQEDHSYGTWRYGTSVFGNPTIVADAKNDNLDAEWEFRPSANGTEMSWAGQQSFGVEEGTMAKAISLMTKPTKAQFGVE
jgi:hypothetical protein